MTEVKMDNRATALRIRGMSVQIKRSGSVDLGAEIMEKTFRSRFRLRF